MLLSEYYPDLDPERIQNLLKHPCFQARCTIMHDVDEFAKELNLRQLEIAGEPTFFYWQKKLNEFYTPLMEGLRKELIDGGWSESELIAAHMIENGTFVINQNEN